MNLGYFGGKAFLPLMVHTEMWERFSYYGMRALLVLFLTSQLGFEDPKAYAIYALMSGLQYAVPVVGGMIADRWLGFRPLVKIGGIILALGHFTMMFGAFDSLFTFVGLGFVCLGTGLFKGNITNLLGACYKADDPERDRGFTIFYQFINIGSFLATVSCGFMAHAFGWHYGFGLAGFGMIVGLLVFLRYENKLLGKVGTATPSGYVPSSTNLFYTFAGAVVAALGVSLMFQHAELFSSLISVVGMIVPLLFAWYFYQANSDERRGMLIVTTMIFFIVFYFAFELQVGAMFVLFTERNVQSSLFGIVVPASISQAINPMSIIIAAPALAALFKRLGPNVAMLRFGVGLLHMVAAFLVLWGSTFWADEVGRVPYSMMFIGMVLIAVGELYVTPLVQSLCTLICPARIRGFMVGFLMMAISYASIAGIVIGKVVAIPKDIGSGVASLLIYKEGFFKFILFNGAVALLFFILIPILHKSYLRQMALLAKEK